MSTFLIKPSFHYSLANNLVDDVQLGRSSYYYFLGKVLPWGITDTPPSTIFNTIGNELSIRDEIVAMEKINGSDVSLVIPRYDWTTGTIYDMWDSEVDMTTKVFYVVTDEYNVYKCISNNNGAPSTIKPFGSSISIVTLSDGYMWKYMYTVPLVKRNKFESPVHIPVQRAISDYFYDVGSVIDVSVANGGSGYVSDNRVTLVVSGGNPTTPAELIATISEATGSISSVTIANQGDGYTSSPTITVVSDTGAGTGQWGPTAIIRPVIQGGKLIRVSIDDPGMDYPSGGSTYVDVDGDGTGLVVVPIVRNGQIQSAVIENRGSGYTYVRLQVIGQGSGAELVPHIGGNDLTTEQSIIESTAIEGGIHFAKIINPGNNYTNATVEIVGDGTGAIAEPVIQGGSITGITMINPGSGYTSAKIVITGDNKINTPIAVDATGYPILSPIGGHGKDAPRELFANTVCLYSVIRYSTSTATNISQDFRQYGVMKNPSTAFTDMNLTEMFALTTYTVTLDGTYGLTKDAILYNGEDKYRIIDMFPGGVCLLLPLNTKNLLVGSSLSTENNVNHYIVSNIGAIPLANKYSGEMLFTSADYSFAFNTNQSVTIKTYIKL